VIPIGCSVICATPQVPLEGVRGTIFIGLHDEPDLAEYIHINGLNVM
jgi:hypothetical protein